jgi:hypothetical protein
MILDNPAKFHNEKILGNGPPDLDNNSFQEGSLTHSLILEPHTVASEYAFFEGFRKAGPEWEQFKVDNIGRRILSAPQKARCLAYQRAYEKNTTAKAILSGGQAELSVCQVIEGVQCKARADYINIEKGYIADIKTSSFPVTLDNFKLTVQQYKYDLSAALYCMVFEAYYGKPFDFYFVCISKKELDCHVYKTSERTMREGKQAVLKALGLYRHCMATGIWAAPPTVEEQDDFEILEV